MICWQSMPPVVGAFRRRSRAAVGPRTERWASYSNQVAKLDHQLRLLYCICRVCFSGCASEPALRRTELVCNDTRRAMRVMLNHGQWTTYEEL
jgi:hypothetical protein